MRSIASSRDVLRHDRQFFRRELRDAVANVLGAEHGLDHLLHGLVPLGRVLGHGLADHAGERLFDAAQVRLGHQVLHQDLAGLDPKNGTWPVSISYSTMPRA